MYSSTKDSQLQSTFDRAHNENRNPMDDIQESVRHLKEDTYKAAAAIRDDFGGVAQRTSAQMRVVANSASHNLGDVSDVLTAKIREKPMHSSIISLAIGVVIGMLYAR